MPLVGFEHAIPAIQLAQIYGLDSADIGIGEEITDLIKKWNYRGSCGCYPHINRWTFCSLFMEKDLGLCVERGEVGQVHLFCVIIIASKNNNYGQHRGLVVRVSDY